MKTTTLTIGLGMLCCALWGGWMAMGGPATDGAAGAGDAELQGLLSARYESATKVLENERNGLLAGIVGWEKVCQAARQVVAAEMELRPKAEDRVAALTKHVEVLLRFEKEATKRAEVGTARLGDVEGFRYWRLTAEVELMRAKRAVAGGK